MGRLAAPFADLAFGSQQAVHGRDRTEVAAFIQEVGVDARGRLVDEAGVVQDAQYVSTFVAAERPRLRCRLTTRPRRRLALAVAPIVRRSGPAQRRTR